MVLLRQPRKCTISSNWVNEPICDSNEAIIVAWNQIIALESPNKLTTTQITQYLVAHTQMQNQHPQLKNQMLSHLLNLI